MPVVSFWNLYRASLEKVNIPFFSNIVSHGGTLMDLILHQAGDNDVNTHLMLFGRKNPSE
jgi:hypothetical protein